MRDAFGKEYENDNRRSSLLLKKRQDLAALEVGTYQVNDDFIYDSGV